MKSPRPALGIDPACVEELLTLHRMNWTGARLESVFRLRALVELSGLSTEDLVRLAAEQAGGAAE